MECSKCNHEIRNNTFTRHFEWCDGSGPRRQLKIPRKMPSKVEARWRTGAWEQVPKGRRRERIMLEQDGCCAVCKNEPIWEGKPLRFQLDHISGNSKDNARQNLRMLCPNCHFQTPTWGYGSVTKEGKQRMIEGFRKGKLSQDRYRLQEGRGGSHPQNSGSNPDNGTKYSDVV